MYRMDKFSAIEYRVKTYLSVQGQLPLVSPDWKKLEQQALPKRAPTLPTERVCKNDGQ